MPCNEFWVRSREARVQISTDQRAYRVGEPIDVSWDDGPANRWGWIGVYHAEAPDPETDDHLLWGYTGGNDSGALPPSVSGSMTSTTPLRDVRGRCPQATTSCTTC